MTESIELLTGQRGSGENRALLVKDLVNIDEMKRKALSNSVNSGGTIGGLPIDAGGIERPHAPVGLIAAGGFTFIAISWNYPTYKGHAYAEVWRGEGDSFAAATLIATEVTNVFSDAVSMGAKYYYWVRFVNVADMKGPIQGASGVLGETQESADLILNQIGGLIEDSHLGDFLSSKISDAAISAEESIQRVQAIDAETDSLARMLIDAALTGDKNWETNTKTIASIESDIGGVKAKINSEFFTMAEATEAIASASETIRAEIEETGLSLSGDIDSTYFTKAGTNEAIAAYGQNLKSQIEDPLGDSIGALLKADYLTSVDVESAITEATTSMASTVKNQVGEEFNAKLTSDYYTKSGVESAISESALQLISEIQDPDGDGLASILFNNYQTKTESEETTANITNKLESAYESSALATIENALATDKGLSERRSAEASITQTQRTIANKSEALAESITTLESSINGVGASLEQISRTVATSSGEFSALWGVKTTVAGMTSSIGLINDGVVPIFAVKGAKFSIITDQNPTNLTPVFAVSKGKTVINTAIIDEAFIKSLVTDDLLANRLLVGSRLTTPSINYNPSNGARSGNFSIDPNGNMFAKSATLQSVTIKDNYGNVVMSSTGAIPSSKVTGLGDLASKDSLGYSELAGKPTLGPFAGLSKILSSNVSTYIASGAIGSAQINQAYINELFGKNASFFGTVYAENMSGDITDTITKPVQSENITSSETQVATLSIASATFARVLYIRRVKMNIPSSGEGGENRYRRSTLSVKRTNGVYLGGGSANGEDAGVEDVTVNISANSSYSIKLMLSTSTKPVSDPIFGTSYPSVLEQDIFFNCSKKEVH